MGSSRKIVSDLYIERPDHKKMVGNIYKGKVQNVIQGMQAAFVDIGYSSNALSIGRLFDRAVLEKPMSEHMFMPLIAALLLTLIFSYLSQNFEKRFQK